MGKVSTSMRNALVLLASASLAVAQQQGVGPASTIQLQPGQFSVFGQPRQQPVNIPGTQGQVVAQFIDETGQSIPIQQLGQPQQQQRFQPQQQQFQPQQQQFQPAPQQQFQPAPQPQRQRPAPQQQQQQFSQFPGQGAPQRRPEAPRAAAPAPRRQPEPGSVNDALGQQVVAAENYVHDPTGDATLSRFQLFQLRKKQEAQGGVAPQA